MELKPDLGWEHTRREMIAETEVFINDALDHPDHAVIIPTIPVGSGCFPKGMASYFWHRVLGDF